MGVFQKELNSSEVVQLTSGPFDVPSSWTPDGKQLAFVRVGTNADEAVGDIYILSADKPNDVRPLLHTRFTENYPEFSPDGHWLAYCSDESGHSELYVRPYPGPGQPVLVSTGAPSSPHGPEVEKNSST